MAVSITKRPRGRPQKTVQKPRVPATIFTLPRGDYEYLYHLIHVKEWGASSVNEWARNLVMREIAEMRRTGYHLKDSPTR
jgi:hypothetical protein